MDGPLGKGIDIAPSIRAYLSWQTYAIWVWKPYSPVTLLTIAILILLVENAYLRPQANMVSSLAVPPELWSNILFVEYSTVNECNFNSLD